MFPAPGGLSSMLAFPFPDGGRYQTTSSSSQTNPFGTHPTQLQADIQRQQQAYSPAFQNFQHPYSYGHDPRTESSNDTPFNALRQSTHVPSVPIHIESAFSPHPSWGSLPQQQQSYDRARVTISGWEVDIDPSTVPSSGPSFGEYNPVPTALPPTPVPISSRFRPGSEGQGKGVEVGRGGWGEEFGKEVRRESTEVAQSTERDIALLQTYLTELIHLMLPFATTSEHPSPPVPPPYLHTRFARLSTLIHTTLLSLGPHIHPYLHPTFDLPLPRGKSTAEKDMEIIRKRRDELIAKAKGPVERGECQTPLTMETTGHPDERRKAMGRCHGCGVGVTHEWRTGPDGPRSLCDSCGLHYAKLTKKRNSEVDKEEYPESAENA